jgi:hypothetical protein
MLDRIMGGAVSGAVIGMCVALVMLMVWKRFGGGSGQSR